MPLVSPLSRPLASPLSGPAPAAAEDDLSFTLTAGTMFSEVGYVSGQYGSISREPLGAEAPLWGLRNNLINTTMVFSFTSFDEDVLGLLDGLVLHVDDVAYPGTWGISEGGIEYTLASPNEIPPLSDGEDYLVELR